MLLPAVAKRKQRWRYNRSAWIFCYFSKIFQVTFLSFSVSRTTFHHSKSVIMVGTQRVNTFKLKLFRFMKNQAVSIMKEK